jgi:hypothetical protein
MISNSINSNNTSHKCDLDLPSNIDIENEILNKIGLKINYEKTEKDININIPRSSHLQSLFPKMDEKVRSSSNFNASMNNTNGSEKVMYRTSAIKKYKATSELNIIMLPKEEKYLDYINEKDVDTESINKNLNCDIQNNSTKTSSDHIEIKEETNLEQLFTEIITEFHLHKLIFDKDFEGVASLIDSKLLLTNKILEFSSNEELQTKIVNSIDLRGNTPLMLCVMLRTDDVNILKHS